MYCVVFPAIFSVYHDCSMVQLVSNVSLSSSKHIFFLNGAILFLWLKWLILKSQQIEVG